MPSRGPGQLGFDKMHVQGQKCVPITALSARHSGVFELDFERTAVKGKDGYTYDNSSMSLSVVPDCGV